MLLALLIPAALLYMGGRMALDRYQALRTAVPIDVVVEEVVRQTFSFRSAGAGRTTQGEHFSFRVRFNVNGRKMVRPLLAADFAPDEIWHSSDEIDPYVFAKGATVPVLLRRDLDYAVTPDQFWSVYLAPILGIAFGLFAALICIPVIYFNFSSPLSIRDPSKLDARPKRSTESMGRSGTAAGPERMRTHSVETDRSTVDKTDSAQGCEGARRRADIGLYLGWSLMLLVSLLLALIGAYPTFDALQFPDRALSADAKISGRSTTTRTGQRPILTYSIAFETEIGARQSLEIVIGEKIAIGETITIYYDPKNPRRVRMEPTISLSEAMHSAGDRIYLTYFSLAFLCLAAVGFKATMPTRPSGSKANP